MNWTEKVAVVTGGASGIGEATARELATEGAAVAILDINAELGERLASELTSEGKRVVFYRVDVSQKEACVQSVSEIVVRWGRIDCLVNCAVSFVGKGLDATSADWERSLGVNVEGAANMAQSCHPAMKATGGGAIVKDRKSVV